MKMNILNENIDFIPENDSDVYDLGRNEFSKSICEFSPENKLIKITVNVKFVLDKLFKNKNNLYG